MSFSFKSECAEGGLVRRGGGFCSGYQMWSLHVEGPGEAQAWGFSNMAISSGVHLDRGLAYEAGV